MDDWTGNLSPEVIAAGLHTEIIGQRVVYFRRIPSTNDEAVRLALDNIPEGTLVIADEQTAGKGRMGRRWLAPPGTSLLFSIVFYPRLDPTQVHRLTMLCSLAVADAISESTGLPARIKWPNDLLIHGKKVGGLLTEAGIQGGRLLYAIVGIGVNVNLDPEVLGRPLTPATSLSHEIGSSVDRLALLRSILRSVDRRYRMLREGWSPRAEWAARLDTLGQRLRLAGRHGVLEGLALDVDEDGALLLKLAGGEVRRVLVGDVTTHLAPETEDQAG